MKKISQLTSFDQIKVLADANRQNLLRLLMAAPATLTQLGKIVGETPAWVRHHVKLLESAGLIEISEIRTDGIVTEKYYRAKAGAFLVQELILPKSKKPVLVLSGSHDLAIEKLAGEMEEHIHILSMPVGSLDGLVNLRQGLCHVTGAHLLDSTGEYNTPFVRRLFPDRPIEMMTLAHRIQGWIVSPGNPLDIRTATDLTRRDVKFVNRNLGSGTRLWLDAELQRLGIPGSVIIGYDTIVTKHTQVARLIARGEANVALGLEAAARRFGLDFVPLFSERYDLIFPKEYAESLSAVFDRLQSSAFRHELDELSGYETAHTGEQIHP